MNIAFLTSYPLDVRAGSGVIRTLIGWQRGLQKLNRPSTLIVSKIEAQAPFSLTNRRLHFNRLITKMDFSRFDRLIGSDFDGYALPEQITQYYYAFNGGLLADIVRFEKGRIAKVLSHLARREQQNLQKACAVFVPSLYSAEKVCSLYHVPEKITHIIPLGNDYDQWQRYLNQTERKKKQEKIILCVARQYPRKGVADLIKAFAVLREKGSDYYLWIAGGGPQLAANRLITEESGLTKVVRFFGDITDRLKLAALFKNSNLFCLPSYHETFGLVYLEAMASGLPVVAYRTTAIPEVVGEDTGILVTPGDIPQLAEAMHFLLENPNQSRKLAQAGKAKAEKMTWQNSAEKLLNILETVR